jgi:O-glycosyl hydrolase
LRLKIRSAVSRDDPKENVVMRMTTAWFLASVSLVIAGCGGGGGGGTCTSNCPTNAISVSVVTPANLATGVAVTSAITATFNIGASAGTITTSTFTLTQQGGGAVAGTASAGNGGLTATFTPSAPLAYSTTYTATLTTGVQSTTGTALASNYTWSFTTGALAAPTVSSVTPANASTGVAITSNVTATFNEAMDSSTITGSTFTLTPLGGSAIAATVAYASGSNTATLTPGASLANNTTYTATITTGAKSSGEIALAANYSWIFTTAAGPAPMVSSVSPTNQSTGVAVTSAITATFSEAMNPSSITGSTFTLTPQGGSPVTATVSVSVDGLTATLTPAGQLGYNTTYNATITTGVQSSLGAALAANYSWTFTTPTAPPLAVSAVSPLSNATGIAITTAVSATFNQAMNSTTINASNFTLTGPGNTSVQGTPGYNSGTLVATFTPSQSLAYNTTYTATISTSVMSSGGAALATPYSWTFTTATAPVPTVSSTVPASGATGANINNALTATFSVPMNSSTVTATTYTLATTSGNTPVGGLVSYNAGTSTATFTPNAALANNTSYTATITTGAESSNNVALASNYVWTFTTAATGNQVTVDFGTTYQTIRGFGGSTAWLGAMPQSVATALFSQSSGIGLSLLRVRIDPEGSASSGNPYETSEWDYEATNGKLAVTANPNAAVFASPWTPPTAWKLNGSSSISDDGETWNESYNTCAQGIGYCGGYLNPTDYAAYATYLEDFVSFFNTTNGFNLYAISMQNEPEENVTYESCVWTPEQMDSWIAGNASTITSDTYSTKLIMPESDSFNPVDASVTLNDPNAQGLVSIIGGHLYGVQPAPYSIPGGDSPKELWMTEFGPLSSATLTWAQALTTYGESIHNSMVTGQYNAYVWWGVFGATTGSCATSAGTCGLVDDAGTLQPMGEVMGQYSKFIQPGFVRVSATASPVSGVFVSAYDYTGVKSYANHYAIVAINANSTPETVDFTLNNGSSVTSLTPYESTSSVSLAAQTAVTVSGGQFSYTLPAQSIVTFVQ